MSIRMHNNTYSAQTQPCGYNKDHLDALFSQVHSITTQPRQPGPNTLSHSLYASKFAPPKGMLAHSAEDLAQEQANSNSPDDCPTGYLDNGDTPFIPHSLLQSKFAALTDDESPAEESVLKECAICIDTLDDPAWTPCSHVFCSECLRQWLEDQHTCPTCRTTCTYQDMFGRPAPTERRHCNRQQSSSSRLILPLGTFNTRR